MPFAQIITLVLEGYCLKSFLNIILYLILKQLKTIQENNFNAYLFNKAISKL
jgi:hypothetical protein